MGMGGTYGRAGYNTALYNTLGQGVNNLFKMLIDRQMKINADERQRRLDPSGLSNEEKQWALENLKKQALEQQIESQGYDNEIKKTEALYAPKNAELSYNLRGEDYVGKALSNNAFAEEHSPEMLGYKRDIAQANAAIAKNNASKENLELTNQLNKNKVQMAREALTQSKNNNALFDQEYEKKKRELGLEAMSISNENAKKNGSLLDSQIENTKARTARLTEYKKGLGGKTEKDLLLERSNLLRQMMALDKGAGDLNVNLSDSTKAYYAEKSMEMRQQLEAVEDEIKKLKSGAATPSVQPKKNKAEEALTGSETANSASETTYPEDKVILGLTQRLGGKSVMGGYTSSIDEYNTKKKLQMATR